MTSLKDRDQSFENRYAHDEETRFRLESRAVRLFGVWVAETMGQAGTAEYAGNLAAFNLKEAGLNDVLAKAAADLAAAGLPTALPALEAKLAECLQEAESQVAK